MGFEKGALPLSLHLLQHTGLLCCPRDNLFLPIHSNENTLFYHRRAGIQRGTAGLFSSVLHSKIHLNSKTARWATLDTKSSEQALVFIFSFSLLKNH